MKICEILERSKDPFVSFEIIPPARGRSAQEIYSIIDELIEFRPPFIDVTSHAADSYYTDTGEGTFERHIKRKRPGTIGLCAAIRYRYKVEAVPHLLCRGFNRNETEDALIELGYLGLDNVLAVRGDDVDYHQEQIAGRAVNEHSLELVQQISDMNKGVYQEDIMNAQKTDFCIGVGGYPEKHPDSPSKAADIRYLKKKVEAGAHYIVTQMFFDNQEFYDFVEGCRAEGIDVPIIPGLKLLTTQKQLSLLPKAFSVNIPDELVRAIEDSSTPAERTEIGIDFMTRQCEDLLNHGVTNLHFFVMKDVQRLKRVIKELKIF